MAQKNNVKRDVGPFAVAVLTVVLICALALRFYQKSQDVSPDQVVPVLDQLACDAAGGVWNACGSACRGAIEGVSCITVCVQQCECRADSDCPFGHTCQEKIEGIGVCK